MDCHLDLVQAVHTQVGGKPRRAAQLGGVHLGVPLQGCEHSLLNLLRVTTEHGLQDATPTTALAFLSVKAGFARLRTRGLLRLTGRASDRAKQRQADTRKGTVMEKVRRRERVSIAA